MIKLFIILSLLLLPGVLMILLSQMRLLITDSDLSIKHQ